ncbi:MAG: FHA domain-containing protein [Eubacteriales bacterium]|nr:FHA domain-containing protein [Eubacteriales bacterium]
MSFTKCANGHIYDPGIYSSCPYCNTPVKEINFDSKDNQQKQGTVGFVDMGSTIPLDGGGSSPTIPVHGGFPNPSGPDPDPNDPFKNPSMPDNRGSGDSNGTVVIGAGEGGTIPVAGWLVCLKGKMRGRSYTLFCKQNTVGRDRKNDAWIQGDNTISGHQANISYDMRHNTFTIVPKTETNTMYLNDEPIYEAARLKEHDMLEMGRSTFVFIPFCGDRYTWNSEDMSRSRID